VTPNPGFKVTVFLKSNISYGQSYYRTSIVPSGARAYFIPGGVGR